MPLNFGGGLFPPTRKLNVNFDFIDIATNIGYVTFDGVDWAINGGIGKSLIPSENTSKLFGSDATILLNTPSTVSFSTQGTIVSSTTATKSIDVDFDTPAFTRPRTIEGEAFVRVGWWNDDLVGAVENQSYVLVRFQKVGGADIATAQMLEVTYTDDRELGVTLPITIPKTTIKKGEAIRIVVEIWQRTGGGASNIRAYLGHHPLDLAVSTIGSNVHSKGNSRMTATIPFKINT